MIARLRLVAVGAALAVAAIAATARASSSATVWLCRPGLAHDPCATSLTATVVTAAGSTSVVHARPAQGSRFDCFYVYPTVSTESTPNADLKVQAAETTAAVAQASRFSQVCNVYAPVYRQITLHELTAHPDLVFPASVGLTAYDSMLAGFEDFLAHDDGRPIVFIGHSQGAALLIRLLQQKVDDVPAFRKRMVLAILLGGNVAVRTGALTGGSFAHLPLCSKQGEAGCVIAYSSFPSEPPPGALFGRPGQGVSAQSGQTAAKGLQVACVNPAALGGGGADLDSFFPSNGLLATPWVEFPGLYKATCESAGGATWLNVVKATGSSDRRPVVTESDGPLWGYHVVDVSLALGNLVADVAAAEKSWPTH